MKHIFIVIGRIISTKKEELMAMLDSFNIQVCVKLHRKF